jgi:hypothetical protein
MSAKYFITLPGKEDETIKADWLTVNEKAGTIDLFKHGAGVGPVASIGIGPGVLVRREEEA